MLNEYEVLKRPLVTEKFTHLTEKFNTYGFEVDSRANKITIKRTVEKIFKVKVLDVKTEIMRGKSKRSKLGVMGKRSNWKKAYVKVNIGEKIPIFEGVWF